MQPSSHRRQQKKKIPDRNQRRIHFLQILLSRKVKSHQKKLELRMKKHRKKRPQTMKSVFLMKLMTVRMKKK